MPKRYKTIVANELPKVDFAQMLRDRMQSAAIAAHNKLIAKSVNDIPDERDE